MRGAPRVVVVGPGLMGASAAWHLARAGLPPTVLERETEAAGGATRWSFGWIGAASRRPSEDPWHHALTLRALEEVRRLDRALGGVPRAAQGVILWEGSPEATAATAAEHRAAGVRMELLSRDRLRRLEPRLAAPPELAALAPDDVAIEPVDLVRRLLLGARDAGATVLLNRAALAVEARAERVTGVRSDAGVIPADAVVLANAAGAQALAGPLGLDLGLRGEPAVLLRLDAEPGLVRHLLCGASVELRPGLPSGLVVAADEPAAGAAGLDALAAAALDSVAALSAPRPALSLLAAASAASAARPMTADGRPLSGALSGIEGLYAAVGHPGAVLAPLLGRLAAEAVAGRLTPS